MSKISLRSKTTSSRLRLNRRRKQHAKKLILKPYDFCCSVDNVDPLTQYDRLRSLYRSPLMSLQTITESPTLKLRTEFTNYMERKLRRKSLKNKQFDIGDHRHKNKKNLQISERLRKLYKAKKLHKQHKLEDTDDDFEFEDLHDKKVTSLLQRPLQWYLEDEIIGAKDILWEQKQRAYNEKMNKNVEIGKQKKNMLKQQTDKYPRWYQDFSINQIKNLRMLQCIMQKDCEEMVTGRTQRTLISIGIISTFFTLTSDVIKKLQESCNCNVIEFLREIYKILTGNYFEEEGYKNFYDCNERIILSAIAFLTLPEAIIELHKRLPPVTMSELPPKPIPPTLPIRQKMKSPYKEKLFIRTDWATFYNRLQDWQEQHRLIPIPNIILPPKNCLLNNYSIAKVNAYYEGNKHGKVQNVSENYQLIQIKNNPSVQTKQPHNISTKTNQERDTSISTKQKKYTFIDTKQKDDVPDRIRRNNPSDNSPYSFELNQDQHNSVANELTENNENEKFKSIIGNAISTKRRIPHNSQISTGLNVPSLYGENRLFDFTINGISEKPGPIEYKICGVLQPPQSNKKSWLGEKHAHYIISGASDEPPTCPVTYEMTGVANVTPTNSNERFFAVLKLGDGAKKIYPSGRQNLSRHWQEWLQNVDEEFRKIEREANKMIKNIEAITKLVFPGPTCDSCCSCRQTRKSYLKAKETKAPYFVIDTITEDDNKKKYIVGSMAMHSPALTPPESTVNLLEVIASEDVLTDNLIISGVTNETGETQYFITGSQKEVIRMPARVIERPPPRPLRNVPPCICAIQQIFTKGLFPNVSHDNIPWTKEEGLCFGKKFRPQESPAYSCKKYPGNKSCRRSPFTHDINRLKRRVEMAKQKQGDEATGKKKMYSIADFQPCGDEHGMNICGGPWNALHTLTSEELKEQERLRKEILRGPSCGKRPGQAVCEGPFGERIPLKPQQIFIEEEIPGEDIEEEEEEEVEGEELIKPPPVEVKGKEKERDKKCHMSPEAIEARRQRVVEKKVKKFVPDPSYPGYDDPWNIFRTAPSEKESETDFKKLLKLSSPKPPGTAVQSKTLMDEIGKSALHENISKSEIRKDHPIVKESKKISPTHSARNTSEQISKKRNREKLKSEEKISEKGFKKSDKKGFKKSQERMIETKSKKLDKNVIRKSEESKKKYNQVTKRDTTKDKVQDQSTPKLVKDKHDQKLNMKSIGNPSLPKYLEKLSDGSNPKKSNIGKETSAIKSQQNMRNVSEVDKRHKKRMSSKKSNHRSITSSNIKKKTISKQLSTRKSVRRDKKKDVINQDVDPETIYRNKINELKNMMKSSELYPYNIKPAEIPDDSPAKCQLEYEDSETTIDTIQVEEDADIQLPTKGPCGWRTKSEQQLPTKKTLIYLTDPDYPPETVPVRSGGKPCVCRDNRAKKKILLYNIGGLIGGKKNGEEKKLLRKKKNEDKKMQVIDGVIYYTPPPSPRRSNEYVPEYDLYESPYDMCLTQRKDRSLKFLDRYGRPKISEVSKNRESCGCNEYVETYGIQTINENEGKAQLLKELESKDKLITAKPPKDRWNLALKDVGLIDYFTRCRDSLPCWLRCAKFNKVGCPISYRELKTKRPVCECKYERKILEHKEEKVKWKQRQKRLKSLKKQPYVNIADISKLLIPNTKLMISDVKRIPREDEYIDDIKYCITGVAENYDHLPPKQIVGGIHMVTPIQTPEPSEHEISCVCLHRHWSPMKITPGPLPKPEEILLAEKKYRQEAVKEAFRQIYAPQSAYHIHDDHSCKEKCGGYLEMENDKNTGKDKQVVQDNSRYIASYLQKPTSIKGKLTNSARHIKSNSDDLQIKTEIKNLPMQKFSETKARSLHKENKDTNVAGQKTFENKVKSSRKEDRDFKIERRDQKYVNVPQKQTRGDIQNDPIELNVENIDIWDKETEEDSDDSKCYLMAIVKIELKKMAAEGFLFAKLPKCFLMPQLQYWLMYRKGLSFSDAAKNKSIRNSIKMWNTLDMGAAKSKITVPSLKMTKIQLRKLTYDDAQEIKTKIALKKAIFYSRVRKERVLYSRSMWNSMEYGKFPSVSFKQAYFTYMASKEGDGYVFKPWLPSEVHEMN
ncbi:uncharacterized protein LOC117238665 isoform X2 [Bombus vosnesenskii]|uniref:Uncharacterized protein LOC117238665 isoform X2 n=1 Tax=Bombus vosnesenskii TaxID=207650 RepID=A0A6J3L6L0_9HYME|nr:uncharacterized protein LOC117238665 isoform X2 [Bombus vosnesenskii]